MAKRGIDQILSVVNNYTDNDLVIEECGEFCSELSGYYVILPRSKYIDMCNLMTVIYSQDVDICRDTFTKKSDEDVVQLCKIFRGRESYTEQFIKIYMGVNNLISSSVGSSHYELQNSNGRENSIGRESDFQGMRHNGNHFNSQPNEQINEQRINHNRHDNLSHVSVSPMDRFRDDYANPVGSNAMGYGSFTKEETSYEEEDPEVIREQQEEINRLNAILREQQSRGAFLESKLTELTGIAQTLQRDLQVKNGELNNTLMNLEKAKPLLALFEGVDVSESDLAMCKDIVYALEPSQAKQVILKILEKDGQDVSDKGKALYVIKTVNVLYELGLL